MPLAEAAGRRYGPVPAAADRSSVSAFVAATGDDPSRWEAHAPPAYAAALLFRVAPAFLGDPDVAPHTRSLLHTEQSFTWHRPLEVGETVEVEGTPTSIRARGALHLVTFEVRAGTWMEGSAGFLLSSEAAAAGDPEPEPAHDARGDDEPPAPAPLPAPGEPVPPMARSASRDGLVRYAGASGDFNPIHWDHDAAVAAGLPGTVVHGLLMASWLAQAAARHAPGPHPLASMRIRFRRPLRPGAQAGVTGTAGEGGELRLAVASGGDTLVSATARVTP